MLADEALGEGGHRRVNAGEATVLRVRVSGRLHALTNTCSHAGGPLGEGSLVDGGIVWLGHHTTPQPTYQTRVRDGKIEVRATE